MELTLHQREMPISSVDPRITHQQLSRLIPSNRDYLDALLQCTMKELQRDIGTAADQTTAVLFSPIMTGIAHIIAKQSGIMAGVQELSYVFEHYLGERSDTTIRLHKRDGDRIERGEVIGEMKGSIVGIIHCERMVINFLGRMCGVASFTAQAVREVEHLASPPLITATRKTLWGLVDKRAVGVGGGGTHRLSLSDGILIKDTHLDPLGRDIAGVIRQYFPAPPRSYPAMAFFEIEVQSIHEALEASETIRALQRDAVVTLPAYILLDNMAADHVMETMMSLRQKDLREAIGVEVSGGITLRNIMSYARSGVDVISMGALTHSASSLDLSLKIK